jgi:hypothetical protein
MLQSNFLIDLVRVMRRSSNQLATFSCFVLAIALAEIEDLQIDTSSYVKMPQSLSTAWRFGKSFNGPLTLHIFEFLNPNRTITTLRTKRAKIDEKIVSAFKFY